VLINLLLQAQEMREFVQGRYGGVGLVISAPPKPKKPAAKPASPPPPPPAAAGDAASVGPTSQVRGGPKDLAELTSGRPTKAPQEAAFPSGILVVNAFEGYAFDAGMRVGDRLMSVSGLGFITHIVFLEHGGSYL
jgi:hypothetical protein